MPKVPNRSYCGASAPAWPGIRRVLADALTPSERRVAELAASGMSNPAIAAQLVISRRTVENHLYRVYAKLGVEGRSQLPAVLTEGEPAR